MLNLKSFEDFLNESITKKIKIENQDKFYNKLISRTALSKDADSGLNCLVINDVPFAQRLERDFDMKVWCIYFDDTETIHKDNYQYVEVTPSEEKDGISDSTKTQIQEIFDGWNIKGVIDYIYNISLKIEPPYTYGVIADLNLYIFNYPYISGEFVYTKGQSRYYTFDESNVSNQFDKILYKSRHLHIAKADLFPSDKTSKVYRFPDKTERQLSIVFTNSGDHLNNIDDVKGGGVTGVELDESDMMSDVTVEGDLIKGVTTPKIYAFYSNYADESIKEKTGRDIHPLKVGDTNRGVAKRITEWKDVFGKEEGMVIHEKSWEWSAILPKSCGEGLKGKMFRDYTIHNILVGEDIKKLNDNKDIRRIIPEDEFRDSDYQAKKYSKEFFENCTPDDVELAIEVLKEKAIAGRQSILSKLKEYTNTRNDDIIPPTHNETRKYTLRGLQQETVDKFEERVGLGGKKLLMYAVMRFGKTYTAFECMKNFYKHHTEHVSGLTVVASAKVDVKNEWIKTINPYSDFKGYDMYDASDTEQGISWLLNNNELNPDGTVKMKKEDWCDKEPEVDLEGKPVLDKDGKPKVKLTPSLEKYLQLHKDKKIVIFVSLQDLNGDVNDRHKDGELVKAEVKDRHISFFECPVDLIIFDEAHFAVEGQKLGKATGEQKVNEAYTPDEDYVPDDEEDGDDGGDQETEDAAERMLNLKNAIRLYLSGTPYKLMLGSKFKEKDIIAKFSFKELIGAKKKWAEDHAPFILSHSKVDIPGDPYNDNGKEKHWEDNPYFGIPQMLQYGYKLEEFRLDTYMKKKTKFTFGKLFETKDKDTPVFKYKEAIKKLFQLLDGGTGVKETGVMSLINLPEIKKGNMCKHIVIVLPNRICCDALEKMINDAPIKDFPNLKKYMIVKAASKIEPVSTEWAKKQIREYAEAGNKTITLTVVKMLTGVTVEPWDTMFYMKDCKSPQEYDQAKFRIMSPYVKEVETVELDDEGNIKLGTPTKIDMKPQTLFVDFSPYRILDMMRQRYEAEARNGDDSRGEDAKKDDTDDLIERKYEEEMDCMPYLIFKDNKLERCKSTSMIEIIDDYRKHTPVSTLLKRTYDWGVEGVKPGDWMKTIKKSKRFAPLKSTAAMEGPGTHAKGEAPEMKGKDGKKITRERSTHEYEGTYADELNSLAQMNETIIRDILLFMLLKFTKDKEKVYKINRVWDDLYHKDHPSNASITAAIFADDLGIKWRHSNDPDKQLAYDIYTAKRIKGKLQTWYNDIIVPLGREGELKEIIVSAQTLFKSNYSDYEQMRITLQDFYDRLGNTEVITPYKTGDKIDGGICKKLFMDGNGDFVIFNKDMTILDFYGSKIGEIAHYLFSDTNEDNLSSANIDNYYLVCRTDKIAALNKKTLSMLLEQLGKSISERRQWLDEHILVYNVLGDDGEKDTTDYNVDENGNLIDGPSPVDENRYINLDTFDSFIHKINEENEEDYDEYDEGDSDEVDMSMIDGLDRSIKRKWGKIIEKNNMRWSIIVGNPPYNNSKFQIYPKFYIWAKQNCDQMSMIFPVGWQEPKDGNGLRLMNNSDVKYDRQIVSIDNIVNGFKGVIGAKNTNIVYWKRGYDNGLNGEQLIYTDGKDPKTKKLLILKAEIEIPVEIKNLIKCVGDCTTMDTVTTSRVPYNLQSDFLKNPIKHGLSDEIMDTRKHKDDIRIFGILNGKRVIKFVDKDYKLPTPHKDCHKGVWKVFLPEAWGAPSGNYLGGSYGDIIIVGPTDICSDNYIESGYCKDFEEAKKHAKYCMSRFARAILVNDKHTHHIKKSNWVSVPVQDYSEDFWNSDNIDDIDEGLFDKYNVPKEIRDFIIKNVQQKSIKNILGYDGKDIDFSKVKEEEIVEPDTSPSSSESLPKSIYDLDPRRLDPNPEIPEDEKYKEEDLQRTYPKQYESYEEDGGDDSFRYWLYKKVKR